MELASFDGTPFMGVYDMSVPSNPVLKQLLPEELSPEGAITLLKRNLFATANEVDLVEDGGVRAHVMIYEYQDAPAAYPTLTSAGASELSGWGAISGMFAKSDGMINAVNDSFYGYQPTIFVIDPSSKPARIVKRIPITRDEYLAQKLNLEGVTTDGKNRFWVASEGRTDRITPHGL